MGSTLRAVCVVLIAGGVVDTAFLQHRFSLVTRESAPKSGPQCQYVGQYLPHEKFCRRFYRCANERFELQCAPGTVWDQSLPGCNADREVKSPVPKGCPDLEEAANTDASEAENAASSSASESSSHVSNTTAVDVDADGEANLDPEELDSDSDSADDSSLENDPPFLKTGTRHH